jgi:hydroxymethylpyrimidine/phosphomethylpyrimidine kinase
MPLRPSQQPQPVALTIAGSDSGGNAGVQADLRTFHGFGVHGCTALTALTAQNPAGVAGVLPVSPVFLRQQLEAVFACYEVHAVKTGMLYDAALVEVVVELLERHRRIPLVVDPVMIATSGARLLDSAAVDLLQRKLLPLASLITPNLPEAEALLGRSLAAEGREGVAIAQARAACELAVRFRCGVLLKGGHGSCAARASDYLAGVGRDVLCLRTTVVRDPLSLHGTGCTLSAAITAALATGCSLAEAVREGKEYVYRAICAGRSLGTRAAVLGMVTRCKVTHVRAEPVVIP